MTKAPFSVQYVRCQGASQFTLQYTIVNDITVVFYINLPEKCIIHNTGKILIIQAEKCFSDI